MLYKYDVRKKRTNNCSVSILCNIYNSDITFVTLEKQVKVICLIYDSLLDVICWNIKGDVTSASFT